jgi:hypothetical protein
LRLFQNNHAKQKKTKTYKKDQNGKPEREEMPDRAIMR